MKYCPKCGHVISNSNRYCPKCGFDLSGLNISNGSGIAESNSNGPTPRYSSVYIYFVIKAFTISILIVGTAGLLFLGLFEVTGNQNWLTQLLGIGSSTTSYIESTNEIQTDAEYSDLPQINDDAYKFDFGYSVNEYQFDGPIQVDGSDHSVNPNRSNIYVYLNGYAIDATDLSASELMKAVLDRLVVREMDQGKMSSANIFDASWCDGSDYHVSCSVNDLIVQIDAEEAIRQMVENGNGYVSINVYDRLTSGTGSKQLYLLAYTNWIHAT